MGKNKVYPPRAAIRPLKRHLERAHAIMADHAEVALSAAEDNIENAARILVDRLVADPAFGGELDEMARADAHPTNDEFDADLDHALRSMFRES